MKAMVLALGVTICLFGCATKTPEEPVRVREHVKLNESMSIYDVCDIMEEYAFNAAKSKVDGIKKKQYDNEFDYSKIPAALLPDILKTIDTAYHLPIKTERDAKAYSRLVYRYCIMRNK